MIKDPAANAEHVAIIMDGNGRWANKRLMPRYHGHTVGAKAVEKTIDAAVKFGIKYLTFFAFSSENVARSQTEINFLKNLFYNNISERLHELHNNNIKVKFIGDLSYFGKDLIAKMSHAEELTTNNTNITVTIALNYGGRWDIVEACKNIIADYKHDNINMVITESIFSKYLSTSGVPDPDLLIRTSGEQRISNFLLWQLAYSEIYFSDVYWPDFDETSFRQALDFYETRQRRFGRVNEDLVNS